MTEEQKILSSLVTLDVKTRRHQKTHTLKFHFDLRVSFVLSKSTSNH